MSLTTIIQSRARPAWQPNLTRKCVRVVWPPSESVAGPSTGQLSVQRSDRRGRTTRRH